MNTRDHKLKVLHQLSLESEPISLNQLVDKLMNEYPERTIRRWLNNLVHEGLIKKIGASKNTKYLVIKKDSNGLFKNSFQDISSCFSSESLKAIARINRPIFERYPVAYNENWFRSYNPNQTYYLSQIIREQLKNAGQRSSGNDPAGTYAHQIYNRLLIDLSYNSSRLEGNTYSLLDTERLLLHGNSPAGKLEEEKIMILNHKEAIRHLVENASKITINVENVFTLHYLLSDGLLDPQSAGKVRDHGVRINGSSYLPFEDPKKINKQLKLICETASKIEDYFEQSLFLLIHISYLQAFADVNKRTARLCSNIPLIKNNFVPLSFNDLDRDDYTSAMIAIYELQEIQPIIDLFVFSYLRTCAAYDSTLKAMGYDATRVRYRPQRRAIIREIITKNFFGPDVSEYINRSADSIPIEDRKDFIQDIYEDLDLMDQSRIAGLGITPEELAFWLKKYQKST